MVLTFFEEDNMMARLNRTFMRIATGALICGNIALGLSLARPAEAAATFGCQNPSDVCACITSTKVCSHIPPLSEFDCHFQSDCNIS
jgi:hypothetical protein